MQSRICLTLGLLTTCLLASTAARASEVALPGPLVTSAWLASHLHEVQIVDIRDDPDSIAVAPKFVVAKDGKKTLSETGGRIPGSLSVDFGAIRQDRVEEGIALKAMMPTAPFFQDAMDRSGLRAGVPIVIAPTGANVESLDIAARLFFQLRYFGDLNVAILNGGNNAWIASGNAVTTELPTTLPGNWRAGAGDPTILASLQQVRDDLHGGSVQFVDARSTDQYLGITRKAPVVVTGGHLAGARSFPTDAISRPVDGAREFMSADAYAAIMTMQHIDRTKPTVTYCNTGHLAAGAWFVLHEILGNPSTRLYAGSMEEWTKLNNPVVGVPL